MEWKKIFGFDKRNMKNENDGRFFRSVNEGSFKFVKVRRLVNIVVEFVLGSRILDVVNDGVQHVHTECTRSEFLVES